MIRILLILGVAFADKLDRTYLPPPGSELSGGNPDALEVPLEQPKLQYPSKDDYLKSPQVTIGIDRVGPKGSPDIYSTISPSIYTPSTYVSTKDVYSTTNPGDDFSKNPYQNFNQPEYDSVSNDNRFQTTENYPQLIQGVVSGKDNSFGSSPNKIKPQDEKNDGISVDVSNSIPNKYFGQNSSSAIPVIQTNNNFKASTLSPSIYGYSSTDKPNQFHSSTPATEELSFNTPVSHTNYYSPVFNSTYIKKHPERIQAQADREAVILNYENSITSDGYAYTFDTSNGIHGDESAIAQNGVKAKGSYSYVGDDGKLYSVKYTADEYGFQPQGEHLPTSPPIPDAILKVIEQAYKEKEAGIFDDGSYDENKYGYRNYHQGFNHPNIYLGKNKLIKNQIANNNDKIPIAGQDFNKNKYTVPENNNIKISGNNLENIDPYFPKESYQINNKPEVKHVIYDNADLETGDEDFNRSPNFFLGSVYKTTESSNDRKQVPTANNVGKYNDFMEEQNSSKEEYSKKPYKESGYQYKLPEYKGLKKFPIPFSDINNIKNEKPQSNKNNVIPKPFLTPYVSQQNYDSYEKPSENTEGEYYGEETTQNSSNDDNDSYPMYDDDNLNAKDSNQPDERIFRKNNQIKLNKTDYDPHTSDEGYSYQQGKKLFNPFVSISPKGYSSSTVIPNEFTTRTSTIKSPYLEFNDEKHQTSEKSIVSSTSSTSAPKYQTKTQLNETNGLPIYDYSSKRPGFTDQYDKNIEQNVAFTGYPNNEFNNTTPRSELFTNIPNFGNSYAPNIDIVSTDKSTAEKNIGEDFSGPKQPQRFDPISGYYY